MEKGKEIQATETWNPKMDQRIYKKRPFEENEGLL